MSDFYLTTCKDRHPNENTKHAYAGYLMPWHKGIIAHREKQRFDNGNLGHSKI